MTLSASPRDAAFAFATAGDWARAVPAAQQALARDPDDAAAHALLALGLTHTNQPRQAVESGRRAVALDPELPFAHYALGHALLENDDVAAAERAAHEALRLDPDADAHALLASCLVRRRRWKEALETATGGLQDDPSHAGCANLRALALSNLGQSGEAESVLQDALGENPENAATHATHGWLMLRQARYDAALESFRTALRLDPAFDNARAGVVEALKSRNGFYRVVLRYSVWMGSLEGRTRWFILLGLFFGARLAGTVLRQNPEWWPVLGPALVLYGLFAVTTWLAGPISNLLLRLNPFGRLVLARHEITASTLVGACLVTAAAAGTFFLVFRAAGWGMLAVASLLMLMPISGAFGAYETRVWPYMRAALALLAVAGAAAVALAFAGSEAAVVPLIALVVGAVIFGWAANWAIIRFG